MFNSNLVESIFKVLIVKETLEKINLFINKVYLQEKNETKWSTCLIQTLLKAYSKS